MIFEFLKFKLNELDRVETTECGWTILNTDGSVRDGLSFAGEVVFSEIMKADGLWVSPLTWACARSWQQKFGQ